MKKLLTTLVFLSCCALANAQQETTTVDTAWKQVYRNTATKLADISHTKLDVSFNYPNAQMNGKEWLTLAPHFYAADDITLDAKGMDIKTVALVNGTAKMPLKYTYNGEQINIKLNKSYNGGEKYTLYFEYISKPNELKVKGSAAINDAKGLYFINPTGEEKDMPTQIWTQGETEANSVWMITIDKPNQKSTEEIYMTVPSKYVTLSNGLLISQKKNTDGTRTDYWKMDLPHSPYLFFMAVGDFAIIKDTYKGKEVNYYVEPNQAQYARGVFGHTPEMIKFYSEKLGVEYPWQKYSQIVGRNFVSGAMENTTATLHQESAYQNNRQLADGNSWESTIAHELFHHWFGDLVTAESWSNITLNESFADYSETLWDEYKYGKDAADANIQKDRSSYLSNPENYTKDLVRFHYADKEDVFDQISYPKGGSILHMLRYVVGDNAFFKALNLYLTTNKFKNGEAHQLRLAFEEVTGQDLSWFWNQWYFGSGHPELKIDYAYDDAAGKATVTVEQTQKTGKIFKLPMAIDVYSGGTKKRYDVVADNITSTFTFNYTQHPDLINVDAEKVLLAVKKDNKTAENYIFQMANAPQYLDRKEALDYFAKNSMIKLADGLKDKYAPLRKYTIDKLAKSKQADDAGVVKIIETLANNETDKKTKAAAIAFLAKTKDAKYKSIYDKNITDSSYSVAGESLKGIVALNSSEAYAYAKKYSTDAKGILGIAVSDIIVKEGTEEDFDIVLNQFKNSPLSQEKIMGIGGFTTYLEKINNIDKLKKGIDEVVNLRLQVPEPYRQYTDPSLKSALDKLGKSKTQTVVDYIKNVWK